MKKLFTTILLVLVAVATWAHDFEVDGIYYKKTNSNEVAVSYRGTSSSDYSNEYSGTVTIPSEVAYSDTTYKVTSIGWGAFSNCTGLTSITIPNSVTSIGSCAFYYCSGLTSITIPNSVKSIGSSAFGGCTSLPVIDNIRYADTYLVEVTDKTQSSYTIKEGTRFIGISAFEDCKGLTSITIPNSVTAIGGSVFSGCSGLSSITVDAGNTVYDSRDNCNAIIETSSNTLIAGCKNTVIPNSVMSIGDYAFSGCTGLTSVTIPNSVTSIGYYVFGGCSGLSSITVDAGNTVYDSRDNCNAIIKTSSNTLITGCKNTVIPNSVMSIGRYAFYGCTGLTSVTIPNSVTSIGGGAFEYCTGLTSITIPNSITSICDCAFWGCTGLTSVTIPNSVTSIGWYAFYGCSGLTSITIPNSVTSIDGLAFCSCTGLTSVTIGNRVTRIGYDAFFDCTGLLEIHSNNATPPTTEFLTFYNVDKTQCTLYVPIGSKEAYATAKEWEDFTNIIEEEGEEPQKPDTCATPTISLVNGKLHFECTTEGVLLHNTVVPATILTNVADSDSSDIEIVTAPSYTVTCYATKEGYIDSETVTKTITLSSCDLNNDGKVDVLDVNAVVNEICK